MDFCQSIMSNTCWHCTCTYKQQWTTLLTTPGVPFKMRHAFWSFALITIVWCHGGNLYQWQLCYCYHSPAKSACFICRDDWAQSNRKMTARYVRENGFHHVVVLLGTLRQYYQYCHILNWFLCEMWNAWITAYWLVGHCQQLCCVHVSLHAHNL